MTLSCTKIDANPKLKFTHFGKEIRNFEYLCLLQFGDSEEIRHNYFVISRKAFLIILTVAGTRVAL
jgi:hypothetical protein